MRGAGQIAELAAIAEPDVGVIISVGPVHVELLGSVEAVAAAKAELIAALAPGATAVVPAGEPLLAPHLGTTSTPSPSAAAGDDAGWSARTGHADDRADGSCWRCEVRFHAGAPAPEPARRGGRRAGGWGSPGGSGRARALTGPRAACRARGRGDADRRLLQREPDVDAGRAGGSGRHRRSAAPARGAWRCWGTCSSSGPTSGAFHATLGARRATRASTCSSPSVRWPPRAPALRRRGRAPVARPRPRPQRSCPADCAGRRRAREGVARRRAGARVPRRTERDAEPPVLSTLSPAAS